MRLEFSSIPQSNPLFSFCHLKKESMHIPYLKDTLENLERYRTSESTMAWLSREKLKIFISGKKI